jgi:hypothetical protein
LLSALVSQDTVGGVECEALREVPNADVAGTDRIDRHGSDCDGEEL